VDRPEGSNQHKTGKYGLCSTDVQDGLVTAVGLDIDCLIGTGPGREHTAVAGMGVEGHSLPPVLPVKAQLAYRGDELQNARPLAVK
jgi:hypothetical protein